MKIYKVELNPSNPVEKIVKIPVCSSYGIQITWNYEQFPKFTGTDTDTENGYLTNHDGKIEENTSFTEINGQKIYTNLPIIENVGNTIVFYYGKYETFEENKVQNFGSIKVVGVDADDFDVDLSGGSSGGTSEGIAYADGNLTLSAENEITLTPYNQTGRNSKYCIKIGGNGNYPMIYPENNYLMLSSNGTVIMGRDLATINAKAGPLNLMTQTGVDFYLGNTTGMTPSVKMEQDSFFSKLSGDALWLKGNTNTVVQGGNVTLGTTGEDGSINFDLNNCFKLGFGNKKSSDFQANVEIYYNEGDAKPYIKLCEGGTYGRTLDTPLYDALAGGSSGGGSNLKWISDKNDQYGVVFIGLCETGDNYWDNAYYTNIAGRTINIGYDIETIDDEGNAGGTNTWTENLRFKSSCVEIYAGTFELKSEYGQPYIGAGSIYIKDTYNEDRFMGNSINIKPGCYLAMEFRDDDESSGRKWIINGKVIDIDRFINEYGSEWYGD
jgi:hypothetical protein